LLTDLCFDSRKILRLIQGNIDAQNVYWPFFD